MAISQVIKFGGKPDDLVWKYGDENITATSRLIVDDTHEAILVVNGIAADLFRGGDHTLSVPNLPIINKIISIPTGGENPFPCKVFYVNKVHQMELLWGTQGSPITLNDPEYDIFLHVMMRGAATIAVEDSRKFLLKLVGFRSTFTNADLMSKFKTLISAHVKNEISKMMIQEKVGFFTMNANLVEVSEKVKATLDQLFEEYGVAVQYFTVEGIDVPEKDYAYIQAAKERNVGRRIEGYTWEAEQQMNIAKTFAANEGMASMGGMMGGMMGGAMMGNAVSDMTRAAMTTGQMAQAPAAAPVEAAPAAPVAGKFCKECGAPVNPGAKFCSNCGTPQSNSCPQCGNPVDAGSKFCSNCGQRL